MNRSKVVDPLSYDRFIAYIQYSSFDAVFFGKIAVARDLVTFEGTSMEELNQGMKEAVDDYLETRRAFR